MKTARTSPHTSGRGRVDATSAESMRGDAQILAGGPVGTGEHVRTEADLGADVAVGKVEDSVELDLVAVEDPREQPLHPDRLAFAEPLQLRDRARPALAEVEDGKASRRVEPTAVKTCALAAQWVIARRKVPKALTGERREWRGGQAAGVDDHALMPSRPRPWPALLRSPCGTRPRRSAPAAFASRGRGSGCAATASPARHAAPTGAGRPPL
jgi:hypothetical protein